MLDPRKKPGTNYSGKRKREGLVKTYTPEPDEPEPKSIVISTPSTSLRAGSGRNLAVD